MLRKNTQESIIRAALALACTLWTGQLARADLLLYEPFDYPVVSNLTVQSGSPLGFDPDSSWQTDGDPDLIGIPGGSIYFGELDVAGHKLFMQENDRKTVSLTRPVDLDLANGELYVSYLLTLINKVDQPVYGRSLFLEGPQAAYRAAAKVVGGSHAGVSAGGPLAETADWTHQAKETYLVVARYDSVGQTNGMQSIWVVSEDEFLAAQADGIHLSELNQIAAERQVHQTGSQLSGILESSASNTVLRLEFADLSVGTDSQVLLDEIRCGTTLADVVPLRSPVPGSFERPNIIFILADDMGYGDAGVYNDESKIPTPNIDRLAHTGLRFTDAHAPSSVCSPTRYALLTGRYAWRSRLSSGVIAAYENLLIEDNRLTMPSLLGQAGYRSACFGKWHLGLDWTPKPGTSYVGNFIAPANVDYTQPIVKGPMSIGFDTYFGDDVPNIPPYAFIKDDRISGPAPSVAKPPEFFGQDGVMQPGWTLESVFPEITRQTIAYLQEQADQGNPDPFFLYCPFNAPHTPLVPSAPYVGMSEAGPYGDFMAQADGVVGEIMALLKKTGLDDNTLVVFTSDNGSPGYATALQGSPLGGIVPTFGHDPNRPWRGLKTDAWEAGHRVPLIVTWPGRVNPGVSDDTVCLVDFFATFAALAGAPYGTDAGEDSWSLLPILLGSPFTPPIRGPVVHHSIRGAFAIREGEQKLIMSTGSGGWSQPVGSTIPTSSTGPGQFYNLSSDPGERSNLFVETDADVVRMRTTLHQYATDDRSAPDLFVSLDSDIDGIPDAWEIDHGLNRLDFSDAALDGDGDRLTNTNEYALDTNPFNPDTDGDRLLDGEEDANRDGMISATETFPTLSDSDNDTFDDYIELLVETDPRDDQSHPAHTQLVVGVESFQRVGFNGSAFDPADVGDWNPDNHPADTVAPYYVREVLGSHNDFSARTRLFIKFDLDETPLYPVSARLRVHQWHRKHSVAGGGFINSLQVSRVRSPWGTTPGNFPLYTQTQVAGERFVGGTEDFGTLPESSGFYSGIFRVPGDEQGIDVLDFIQPWVDGTEANHGIRFRFSDEAFSAIALSSVDDPATTNVNEALALIVDTIDPSFFTAFKRWQLRTAGSGVGPIANRDGDPYADLVEYVLGLDPNVSDEAGLGFFFRPRGPATDLVFEQRQGIEGVDVVLEETASLVNPDWQACPMVPIISALPGEMEEVIYADALRQAPETVRFYRLSFSGR